MLQGERRLIGLGGPASELSGTVVTVWKPQDRSHPRQRLPECPIDRSTTIIAQPGRLFLADLQRRERQVELSRLVPIAGSGLFPGTQHQSPAQPIEIAHGGRPIQPILA